MDRFFRSVQGDDEWTTYCWSEPSAAKGAPGPSSRGPLGTSGADRTHLIGVDELGAGGLATVSAGIPVWVTNRGRKARGITVKGGFEQEFVQRRGKETKPTRPFAERSLPKPAAPILSFPGNGEGFAHWTEDCGAVLRLSGMLFESISKVDAKAEPAAIRLRIARSSPRERLCRGRRADSRHCRAPHKAPAGKRAFTPGVLPLLVRLSFLLRREPCVQTRVASLENGVSSFPRFGTLCAGFEATGGVPKTLTRFSRAGIRPSKRQPVHWE